MFSVVVSSLIAQPLHIIIIIDRGGGGDDDVENRCYTMKRKRKERKNEADEHVITFEDDCRQLLARGGQGFRHICMG